MNKSFQVSPELQLSSKERLREYLFRMVRLRSEGKKKKSVHVSKAPAFLDFLFVRRNVCNLENFMLASVSFWKGQKVVRSRVCEIHED